MGVYIGKDDSILKVMDVGSHRRLAVRAEGSEELKHGVEFFSTWIMHLAIPSLQWVGADGV